MVKNFKLGLVFLSLVLVAFAVFVLALGIDTVNLVTPTDDFWTNGNNDTINFTFNYTGDNATASCELFINGTSFGENGTVLNITDTTMLANHSIEDGSYNWSVTCTNGTSVSADNFTLNVDTIAPVISAPAAAVLEYKAEALSVTFTASDASTITWSSNETGNFTINSSTGVLINDTILVVDLYSILVTVTDASGNTNTSVYSVNVSDTIAPVASASCSPSSVYTGAVVTCTCSGADTSGSGINSSLTTAISTPSTSTTGTFTYTCSVTDYAGNSDSNTASYTVSSSGGGSSNFVPIYRPSESKLSEGYDISLGKNYEVQFQISAQSHTLKVDSISTDSATITISSDPITLDISVGDTEKVDLDDDGYYDLSIYLKEIKFSKVNFVLTSINEAISSSDSAVQDGEAQDGEVIQDGAVADGVVEVDEESNYMIWIILVIVLIIVGVIASKKFKE